MNDSPPTPPPAASIKGAEELGPSPEEPKPSEKSSGANEASSFVDQDAGGEPENKTMKNMPMHTMQPNELQLQALLSEKSQNAASLDVGYLQRDDTSAVGAGGASSFVIDHGDAPKFEMDAMNDAPNKAPTELEEPVERTGRSQIAVPLEMRDASVVEPICAPGADIVDHDPGKFKIDTLNNPQQAMTLPEIYRSLEMRDRQRERNTNNEQLSLSIQPNEPQAKTSPRKNAAAAVSAINAAAGTSGGTVKRKRERPKTVSVPHPNLVESIEHPPLSEESQHSVFLEIRSPQHYCSHLATEPEALLGGKQQKLRKRALKMNDAQADGCTEIMEKESSGALDDILPPTKKVKSNDGQKCGSPAKDMGGKAQSVARQCPKCAVVIQFRSERASVSGLRMHISRCFKRQYIPPSMDYTSSRQESPSNRRNNTSIYSAVKDSNISKKDMNILKKRKHFCQPPDPRPCYGCMWCGPHQRHDAADGETICPICKMLEEKGWFRWIQETACKMIFIDERQRQHKSIRAFLTDSTKVISTTIEQMSPEDRSVLLAKLFVVEEGKEEIVDTLEGKPAASSPPAARIRRDRSSKKSSSGSIHGEKSSSAVHNEKISIVSGISMPAFAKAIASKQGISVAEDINTTSYQNTTMAKRKAFVQDPDPRPAWGCGWCGVVPASKRSAPDELQGGMCPICKSLEKFGWGEKIYSTGRHFRDPDNRGINGVKGFLCGTTNMVCEAMKWMTPADCTALKAKYKEVIQVGVSPGDQSLDRATASGCRKCQKELENGEKTKMEHGDDCPRKRRSVAGSPGRQEKKHHESVEHDENGRREDKASSSTNKSYTRDECVSMDATSIHDQEGLQDHNAIECENESQSSVVEEISIADFAKSIVFRQNTYVQLGNDSIVPTRESNILQKRRQNVRDPDPRPAWGCEWCGLTKYAKRSSDYEQILCPICWSLQKQCRWEMKHYSTSKFFMGPSKKSCRGVKDFLFNSTDIVCKALKSMSHANISVLQGKYTQANKSDKKPHFVKRSISSNLDKKTSGISKSESRLSKSRSGISDFSTKSEVLEGVEGETGGRTVEVPMSIELPAISQLLEEKRGLSGVLQADMLQVYNLHFGTNANIACRILMCLGKGQLSASVLSETPFLRSTEEVQTLSRPSGISPSRFVGVFHVKRTLGDGKEETSFGVTIPQFYANCDWSSNVERTANGHIAPKVATVNGRPVLLRIGVDEDVAGKLFSFCYRVMYGSDAVSDILSEERNSNGKSLAQDNENAAALSIPHADKSAENTSSPPPVDLSRAEEPNGSLLS